MLLMLIGALVVLVFFFSCWLCILLSSLQGPNSILVALVMLINVGLAIIFVHFLTWPSLNSGGSNDKSSVGMNRFHLFKVQGLRFRYLADTEYRYEYLIILLQFKEPVNPLFQREFKHYGLKKSVLGRDFLERGWCVGSMVTAQGNFVILF